MKQYQDIKNNHPDAIVFFRLGDFYEMFGPDAVTASKVLQITLTSRDKGKADPLPMCGILPRWPSRRPDCRFPPRSFRTAVRTTRAMKALPEKLRFPRGLRAWVGFRQNGLEYDRPPRAAGRSKYGWRRLYRLATDGVVSSSVRPLLRAPFSNRSSAWSLCSGGAQ